MAKATVAAWRDAVDVGQSAAMMAPTREAVAVLNDLAQRARFVGGELDPASPSVQVGEGRAHVCDVVATRRNERTLLTDRQRMVKNCDHWTVAEVRRNGSLTVDGPTGRVTLPADYVAADVELAYAETSHANQSRTVDRSFLYLDGPTGTAGIYVPLTRGRTTNEAFVVLHDERSAADIVAEAVARTWIDQPATAVRLDRPNGVSDATLAGQRGGLDPVRREPLPEDELRTLAKRAARHEAAAYDHRHRLEGHDRTLADLAMRQDELPELIRQAEARLARATRTLDQHDRPLRRRGHTTEIAKARSEANELPGRIDALRDELAESPAVMAAEQAAQDRTETRHRLFHGRDADRVHVALADDARTRGERLAEDPPRLLVEHLGAVPADPTARDRWITAAGRGDQHRALWDLADTTLVGSRPPIGQPDYGITYYAANRAIADLGEAVDLPRTTPERDAPSLSL